MALHVLGHIDTHHGVLITEHGFSQRLAQLRLAHAGGTQEQERTDGTMGILQAHTAAADGTGHGGHGVILTDDTGVEGLFQLQQAAADKQNAEQNYKKAEQLLRELVESGYATISTKLNLATVLQALNQYQEADDILTELAQQYPLDYRFDMQRAYLLIDWQGTKPAEKREYQLADDCYESAVQKYRQAQANGTEDAQMTVLKNLIDQLYTSGWLK